MGGASAAFAVEETTAAAGCGGNEVLPREGSLGAGSATAAGAGGMRSWNSAGPAADNVASLSLYGLANESTDRVRGLIRGGARRHGKRLYLDPDGSCAIAQI